MELTRILNEKDIPKQLNETPIVDLLRYHNLNLELRTYENPQLAIVMCMDNRKQLRIPNRFAFILRTPAARITGREFNLSFAIGFGGIRHVALIGHTGCGMVNLLAKKEVIVKGLIEIAGWTKEQAESHFDTFAPQYEITNESEFIAAESNRLVEKYPKVCFVPMLYKIEDHKLYLIK